MQGLGGKAAQWRMEEDMNGREAKKCTDHDEEAEDEVAGLVGELCHEIQVLRRTVAQHDRQLKAVREDKEAHCQWMVQVFTEIEKVLRGIDMAAVKNAIVTPLAEISDLVGTEHLSAAHTSLAKELMSALNFQQEKVCGVLLDYRHQLEQMDTQLNRRLASLESDIQMALSDMRDLRSEVQQLQEAQTVLMRKIEHSVEAEQRRYTESRRESALTSHHRLLTLEDSTQDIVQQLNTLKNDIAGLSAAQSDATRLHRKSLQAALKEQSNTQRIVESHSDILSELQAQGSLDGAFREVKDWLVDLEKRMVSRGEMLQWTDSFQCELSRLRQSSHGVFYEAAASVGAALPPSDDGE